MAITNFLGAAVPIPEQQTLTVAGTWLADEDLIVTLNGKDLTLTTGTTVTNAQVAADLADMINGEAANQDEIRSTLGSSVGEWKELTATVSGAVVTVTGQADGKPSGTISTDVTDSASGTCTRASSVPASGPHDVNVAENWTEGSVPGASDQIVFDHNAASDCLYNLGQLAAVAVTSVTVSKNFRHNIGLPAVNRKNSAYPYDEPQETYLQIGGGTVSIDAANAGRIKIDAGANDVDFTVDSTGSNDEPNTPAVLIKVNHASPDINVRAGSVGINWPDKITGQNATLYVTGGTVELGDTHTVATIKNNGGKIIVKNGFTTLTNSQGSVEHHEGNATTVNMYNGTYFAMHNDTVTLLNLYNEAVVDCNKDARDRIFTATNIYGGKAKIKDSLGTVTYTAAPSVFGGGGLSGSYESAPAPPP